jgi:hypothetical protein
MKPTFRLLHWMQRIFLLFSIIIITGACLLSAQDNLSNGKALNIPFRKYGISIGNSYEFTGVRINFADENVKRINGLNVTFRGKDIVHQNSIVNGISLGVFAAANSMQPINIGLLAIGARNSLSGFSIGGLATAGEHINGLCTSGILVLGDSINGISISGLYTKADVISGIAISGIEVTGVEDINGLAVGVFGITSFERDYNGKTSSLRILGNNFKGVGITAGYLKSNIFKGIAIAGYARTNQMFGLSVALYNRTDELHGLQLGLLNYAGNNSKGLRMLPFINLHLRR